MIRMDEWFHVAQFARPKLINMTDAMESTEKPIELIPQPHGGALRPAWKKGESPNPGRKTAGAYVSEHYNRLAYLCDNGELDVNGLAQIAKDDPNPNRRIAARQYMEGMGADLADFEPFLRGEQTLASLRESGKFTGMIKKATIRRSDEGEQISLELRSGGEALDRIADRTEGKPTQRHEVTRVDVDPGQLIQAQVALMQQAAALLRQCPQIVADVPALPVHDVQPNP